MFVIGWCSILIFLCIPKMIRTFSFRCTIFGITWIIRLNCGSSSTTGFASVSFCWPCSVSTAPTSLSEPASVPPSVPASTTGFVCFSVLTYCSVCASPPIGSALTTFTLPQKKHTPIKTLATPTVNLRIAKRSTLLLFSNMMLPSYLFMYTLSLITILYSACCYFIQNLLKKYARIKIS